MWVAISKERVSRGSPGSGLRSAVVLLSLLAFACYASAHGGRTNKAGCHNDRKSGTYHCH
ncbi:YHYH domain-containing protein [Acidovorax soli]|uniref:YHYH domain-containing protein n=1 Tax=Acidovorax soli TaxID=592050 RepID=UPI0016139F6A